MDSFTVSGGLFLSDHSILVFLRVVVDGVELTLIGVL